MDKYTGLLEDNRSSLERKKDFRHEELFGSPEVSWLTKKEADKMEGVFPERNQKSTSACVCYSAVTALYDTEDEILSPGYLYSQRFNKPQEGCYFFNIGDLVVKQGVAKESVLETPLKESEINVIKITDEARNDALPYRQKSYIFLENPTADQLADLSNRGIAVILSIFGNSKEWGQEYPIVIDSSMTPLTATINHAITVLPNTGYKHGGIKHVKIQDSAHFGNIVYRDLSEQWIAKRAKHAMYFIDLDKAPTDFPEHLRGYTWNNDLTVGDKDKAVVYLQDFLKYKGFFPKNTDSTGYFGGITRKAVSDYQKSKGIKPDVGYFGPITRTEANKETF